MYPSLNFSFLTPRPCGSSVSAENCSEFLFSPLPIPDDFNSSSISSSSSSSSISIRSSSVPSDLSDPYDFSATDLFLAPVGSKSPLVESSKSSSIESSSDSSPSANFTFLTLGEFPAGADLY